jgi:hypothetical protein
MSPSSLLYPGNEVIDGSVGKGIPDFRISPKKFLEIQFRRWTKVRAILHIVLKRPNFCAQFVFQGPSTFAALLQLISAYPRLSEPGAASQWVGLASSSEPVLGKENIHCHYCGTSAALLPLACCTHNGLLHARMITLGMMEAAAATIKALSQPTPNWH